MITFLFIGLFGTGVFFAGLPIVCFALMLETCERRRVELTANGVEVAARVSSPAAHELPIPRPTSVGVPTVRGLGVDANGHRANERSHGDGSLHGTLLAQ